MKVTAKTKICMVIGDPIEHSLSPQIHNAGYEALKIDSDFIYVACNIHIDDLKDFIKSIKVMKIKGVSCTIPHKIEVMKYLDEIDETAKKIGAVNTIVNKNGILKGYNTDWLGVVTPLERVTSLKDKKIALLGAGGAARAAVYGLSGKGAHLTIFNRSIEKANDLAKEFDCTSESLDNIEKVKNMDIIINATSIGLYPNTSDTPLPKALITNNHIILDIIYNPIKTKLLIDAEEKGATIIHGFEMLLGQALGQFKLYTGHDAPIDAMRKTLLENLKEGEK